MSGFMLHAQGTKRTIARRLGEVRKATEFEDEPQHLDAAFDTAAKMAQRFKGEVTVTVAGAGNEDVERLEIHVGLA